MRGRVEALERETGGFKAWHRIIVRLGQTEAEARAAYEAENGPLGDDECLIVRIFQRPESCA
ncbi:hypothetical protein [Novosphingobium marinum]|uniref:Uncharacterized protein n=1 Tax=Novosphingobium marinum TaxID=1514948 RepID=A0A7Y9XXB5_9SPHN|nr:hypothetical protein [Novosphingobium marinum]NYH96287.1 hypothetical protein [Novosphingobium marinum]